MTVLRVIMGYGAVHPSGDLYGNILPSGLVNAYGLKTVIENNNIYYKAPGTSLVSHMKYTGSGNYSRVTIGLNNKVAGERLSLLQSGNNFIYSYSWDDEDAPWFAWPWGKAIVTATAGELIYGIRNTAPVLTDMLAKTYRVRTGASASFDTGLGDKRRRGVPFWQDVFP
jgi:hypothetical protein